MIWRSGIVAIALAVALPAAAQEVTVEEQAVRACFAQSDMLDGLPECVGRAADACQAVYGYSTIDTSSCLSAEAQVWDVLLNEVYGQVRPELASRDETYGYSIPTAEALLEAQRAWIAFRDAECGLQYAMYQDGTIRSIVGASCHMQMTARRVFELRALLEP